MPALVLAPASVVLEVPALLCDVVEASELVVWLDVELWLPLDEPVSTGVLPVEPELSPAAAFGLKHPGAITSRSAGANRRDVRGILLRLWESAVCGATLAGLRVQVGEGGTRWGRPVLANLEHVRLRAGPLQQGG